MSETPTLAQVIRNAMTARLEDVHTTLPGIVDKYDATTCFAQVSPSLKRVYTATGKVVDMPALVSVPLVFPRCNDGMTYISMPVKKGDPVILHFCERSLDVWKTTGGKVDPRDRRMHHLSDAFAVLGGFPKAMPMLDGNADDIVINHEMTKLTITAAGGITGQNPDASFQLSDDGGFLVENDGGSFSLSPDGKFSYANGAGDELVDILVQLFTEISTGVTATAMGPQLLTMPGFAALKTKLEAFKA